MTFMPDVKSTGPKGLWSALVLAAGLIVSGCGDKNTAQNTQKGQVIAKVGDTDVTIHELQNEYRHLRVPQDKINDDVTRDVMNEIVKRKAFAQRAQAAKLDREPTVLLDLLRSREQVLASTLLQRDLQTKLSGLSKAETDRYINANPARFGNRIRFDIDRLVMPSEAETPEFVEAVKAATDLDAVEKAIAARKIQYTRGASSIFGVDMPPELLTRIAARKDSDVFVVKNGQQSLYFKVRGEVQDPLVGEEASRIAQTLVRNETAQAELQRKSEAGDIPVTYFGDFEKIMAAPPKAK